MAKVDTYIEKAWNNQYKMFFYYNDVEFCFLYTDPDMANFAAYFKRKAGPIRGVKCTDTHGWTKPEDLHDSVIASVEGLDCIDDSIVTLSMACTNLDIQADLTVHVDGEVYPIVRDADGQKYRSHDIGGFSKKGHDMDQIVALSMKLSKMKENEPKERSY